ncbi:hypothetical protein QUA27_00715 [Microcoleus sp. Pol14C6]|uniref:hypothetical protein n=1 Tax=unclassified Microcoleus TaxID=2642155 RepID=UPI002FD6D658
MAPQYRGGTRSTFLVYPIAGVARSPECDPLPVLIFGVISIVKLDGKRAWGRSPIYNTWCVREHP